MGIHQIMMKRRLAILDAAPPVYVAPVSDLVASNPTETTMDLDWTAPVGSDNAIDYYEVWVDGVFYENTVDDSVTWEVTGLTAGTEYDFQLKTVDVLGNKSALSNTSTESTIAGFVFVADLVSGFIHGYSQARKLRSAYAGDILNVRRSSDNTNLDIGEDSNVLDESALTTFVGANNGFVETFYDQVGARNMTQATDANQPQIVASGTVIKVSGKPYAQYNGTSHYLPSSSATPITDLDCTVFVVFESQASDSVGCLFNEHNGSVGQTVRIDSDTTNSNFFHTRYQPTGAGASTALSFASQQPQSTKRVYIFRKSGTTIEAYDESGSLIDSDTVATVFGSDTLLILGRLNNPTPAAYFSGKIAELLINNTALGTTDRNTVLDNIKDFYSIT